MSVKEDLEIILFTFNRKQYLERTMNYLLHEDSPVKDFKITVVDNKSIDGTEEYLTELANKKNNLIYLRNKFNYSGGTIIKGFDSITKKYVWMIADDDVYDWSNWSEVEEAIKRDEDIICIANYCIKDKNKLEEVILQMTFYPSMIYKASNITDEVAFNFSHNIYMLFWHFPIICSVLNKGKTIYVCDKWIVNNGMMVDVDFGIEVDGTVSRGYNADELYPRNRNMSWGIGFANAVALLKDKDLKERVMEIAQTFQNLTFKDYIKMHIRQEIVDVERWSNLTDLYAQCSKSQRKRFRLYLVHYVLGRIKTLKPKLRKDDDGVTLVIFNKIKIKIWKKNLKSRTVCKNT